MAVDLFGRGLSEQKIDSFRLVVRAFLRSHRVEIYTLRRIGVLR